MRLYRHFPHEFITEINQAHREKNVIIRNYRQNKRLTNLTFSANTIYPKCVQSCVDIRPHAMGR